MRILSLSICKCCGFFDDDPKDTTETTHKEEINCITINPKKDSGFESPFRIKEIRQRSVDYVVHSPRFGGAGFPDGTGGTGSSPKKVPKENIT